MEGQDLPSIFNKAGFTLNFISINTECVIKDHEGKEGKDSHLNFSPVTSSVQCNA